jgi:hypothetical protein
VPYDAISFCVLVLRNGCRSAEVTVKPVEYETVNPHTTRNVQSFNPSDCAPFSSRDMPRICPCICPFHTGADAIYAHFVHLGLAISAISSDMGGLGADASFLHRAYRERANSLTRCTIKTYKYRQPRPHTTSHPRPHTTSPTPPHPCPRTTAPTPSHCPLTLPHASALEPHTRADRGALACV